MIFKDIVVKKKYVVQGQEKVKWLNVGTLKETDDGKQFIELNIFPGQDFYIFEKREKEVKQAERPQDNIGQDEPIDLDSIPF